MRRRRGRSFHKRVGTERRYIARAAPARQSPRRWRFLAGTMQLESGADCVIPKSVEDRTMRPGRAEGNQPVAAATGSPQKRAPPRQGRWHLCRPGRGLTVSQQVRWLTPPANFRGAFGSGEGPVFKLVRSKALMQRVWIFPAEDAEFPNAQCHPRTTNHAPRVGVPQDDSFGERASASAGEVGK